MVIEGGKTTDATRRAFLKKLPTAADQFVIVEKKSDSRAVLFEWLDTLGLNVDLSDDRWLLEVTRMYLERRDPKSNWEEIFAEVRAVRRSSRITEGWERDNARLYLAPSLYGEAILIQYLVSRSHAHGGSTLEGRLTLMELIRRLRYLGYLEQVGIDERDPGEVFEKLIDHLAARHEWSRSEQLSTAKATKKKAVKAKSSKKTAQSRKPKIGAPVTADQVVTEAVKLYYVIDRRDFLEKVKSVYASYA